MKFNGSKWITLESCDYYTILESFLLIPIKIQVGNIKQIQAYIKCDEQNRPKKFAVKQLNYIFKKQWNNKEQPYYISKWTVVRIKV